MSKKHPELEEKFVALDSKVPEELKDVVLRFLFVFNIFESEFFDETKRTNVPGRIKGIQEYYDKHHFLLYELERFHSHFSIVYLYKEDSKERLDTLCESLSDEEEKQLRSFLTLPLNHEENKKFVLTNALKLSYKFRNNLFHGTKVLTSLWVYKDDFEVITSFFIDLMRKLNSKGAGKF